MDKQNTLGFVKMIYFILTLLCFTNANLVYSYSEISQRDNNTQTDFIASVDHHIDNENDNINTTVHSSQTNVGGSNESNISSLHDAAHSTKNASHHPMEPISFLWCIPFILILLCIAVFPLVAPHFWHHNYWKISLFVFGLPMFLVSMFFLNEHVQEKMIHEMQSYVSFILLLASLFTISGAIVIRGSLVGKPALNTALIIIGGVLASFMTTTGASMLLIRPLIRANKFRHYKVHTIIFFIFVVSNTGGLLTALGDPPLFLGYLEGVPFTWTFNLFFHWLFVNASLVLIYFVWDSLVYRSELKKGLVHEDISSAPKEPLAIRGGVQFILLAGVVLSIYLQGYLSRLATSDPAWSWWPHFGFQEIAMLTMMLLSLWIAKPNSQIRQDNEFSWFPIKEVAALFAGIFACMSPTLYLLDLYGTEFGIQHAWQFFWITGSLSSFLDNAPTYLVFLELAKSTLGTDVTGVVAQADFLGAISCGAVFMGAMTYIGNAPNFMVSSIARERGIVMPSFFRYMLYSCSILLPLFCMLTFIFFM